MPSTSYITFANTKLEPAILPEMAKMNSVKLVASKTYKAGMILGESVTPGVYDKFDNASITIPKVILAYDVVTDSSGNPTGITYPYPPWPDLSVPAYVQGYFDVATINTAMGDGGTLLAAALAYSGFNWGRLVEGSTTAGIVAL